MPHSPRQDTARRALTMNAPQEVMLINSQIPVVIERMRGPEVVAGNAQYRWQRRLGD
jgi:hypothetical protein